MWATVPHPAPLRPSSCAPPQCLLLLPALSVIAHDGSDAREVTVRSVEQGYSEGDREALAIFAQGRTRRTSAW